MDSGRTPATYGDLVDRLQAARRELEVNAGRLNAVLGSVKVLLGSAGTRRACRSCSRIVYFVRHLNGKCGIYDEDGLSHFATCPYAANHRKRGTDAGDEMGARP